MVLAGQLIGFHGFFGCFKVKSEFLQLRQIFSKTNPKLEDSDKVLQFVDCVAGLPIVKILNVESRQDAMQFLGKKLFVPRSALSSIESNAIYVVDLIGLNVMIESKIGLVLYGKVVDVPNYGSGDLLEIEPSNTITIGNGKKREHTKNRKTELYPFLDRLFPTVNIDDGFVILRKLNVFLSLL